MDEPTNHLDAESVEWLQSYLSGFRGALLLITPRSLLFRSSHQPHSGNRPGRPLQLLRQLRLLSGEKKAEVEAAEVSTQKKSTLECCGGNWNG